MPSVSETLRLLLESLVAHAAVGFSRNLKTLRVATGYTQESLADMISGNDPYIPRLERRDVSVSLVTLAEYARKLGVQPTDLLKEIE